MDRNLCVSASVKDTLIHRAWSKLIGNNSIQRIELRESKKIIHLFPSWMEQLDEDELAEIEDMYLELEEKGTLTFWLHPTSDPTAEWWLYGDPENNTVHFEVCFE